MTKADKLIGTVRNQLLIRCKVRGLNFFKASCDIHREGYLQELIDKGEQYREDNGHHPEAEGESRQRGVILD